MGARLPSWRRPDPHTWPCLRNRHHLMHFTDTILWQLKLSSVKSGWWTVLADCSSVVEGQQQSMQWVDGSWSMGQMGRFSDGSQRWNFNCLSHVGGQAKFHQNPSSGCINRAFIFNGFPRWRPSAILDGSHESWEQSASDGLNQSINQSIMYF